MRDRLRTLAKQAWLRISQAGLDPVESIHRALLRVAADKTVIPEWFGKVTKAQREVVLVLASGPMSTPDVARELGISGLAACLRLRSLRKKKLVYHARYRYWRLVMTPPQRKTR